MKKDTVAGNPVLYIGGIVLLIIVSTLVVIQGRELFSLYAGSETAAPAPPGPGTAAAPEEWASIAPVEIPDLKNDPAKFDYRPSVPQPAPAVPFNHPFLNDPRFRPAEPGPANPFEFMDTLRAEVDLLFGEFGLNAEFEIATARISRGTATRVTEDEGKYVVTMDVGSDELNDLEVDVSNQHLSVSGTSWKVIERADAGEPVQQTRKQEPFQQSFRLPGPIKQNEILYRFENGVLTIILPKNSVQAPPRNPKLHMV